MKVALCLQGLSSGCSEKESLKGVQVSHVEGLQTIKENILDLNDVDVFMHTWGTNQPHLDNLINSYRPIYAAFEDQISFSVTDDSLLPPPTVDNEKNPRLKYHYTSSRWYSHQQSLNLKKRYEEENEFKYDFVMVSRFDVCYFTPFNFSTYDPQSFYASEDFLEDENLFNDVWFFGNSELMDKFSTVYNYLDFYIKDLGKSLSSHEISRKHVINMGFQDKVKYTKKIGTDYQLLRRL